MKHTVSMTVWERTLGWCWYFVSLFALPFFIGLLNLSPAIRNALGLGLNAVCLLFILYRYLWKSLIQALKTPGKTLSCALGGLILYQAGLYLINQIIFILFPEHINANDQNIQSMIGENPLLTGLAVCVFAPVSEELFYRALPFDTLVSKSRPGAWLLSTVLFSLAHVLGYLGAASIPTLLLCFIQYIPAGLCLAWAYEASGTVAAPIVLHMLVNILAYISVR